MRKKMLAKAGDYLARKKSRSLWMKGVTVLACAVVFCTVYALILPALTLENPACGLEEHTHTEACYIKVSEADDCDASSWESDTIQGHTHTDECYVTERGRLICEKTETDGHTHTEECSAAEQGELICRLEETDGHTHTEECGVTEQKTLICTEEETDGHAHTEACRSTEKKLVCGQEDTGEHAHTEECYDEEGNLCCGKEETEGHHHSEDCYEESSSLTCGQAEAEAHHHSADCYEITSAAACGLEETEGHHHSADCYGQGLDEGCGLEETEAHHHDDACYETEKKLICRTEQPDSPDELTCKKPESEGHSHKEECYDENGELICGLEESPGHKHSAICYGNWKLVCELEEHTHTEDCYDRPLTEEEQKQVDEVIAMIDALPDRNEIEEKLTAFEEAEDEEGYDAYLTEIVTRAKAAYEAYSALTEVQKKKVTNAARLAALESLWSVQTLPEAENTDPKRLFLYAGEKGGEVTITVSDSTGVMTPDEGGEYTVTAGETYKVRVAYEGNVLEQGKYYVTFAANIDLTQRGELSFTDNQGNGIDAGSWYFEEKEDGTVWLIFEITGDLSAHSAIVLTADVTCRFDYTDDPVEFDGNITVNVQHNEDSPNTDVNKWARDPEKPGQIKWGSEVYGNSGSNIIGNTVTDTIITDTHYFSAADREAGIEFEATKYKPESPFTKENIVETHSWIVKEGTDGLIWDEKHWTYTMPETITCKDCKQEITLGNDDWLYYMKYTSTIREDLPGGYTRFENEIACDGDNAVGSTYTGATSSDARVVKTGRYTQNPDPGLDPATGNPYENDTFDWTITVEIPAAREGEKFDYFWYLMDHLRVKEEGKNTYCENPLKSIRVTAEIDGETETIEVPEYESPEAEDAEICWHREWEDPNDHGQQIDFYTKCYCTEENCPTWKNGACGDQKDRGFCRCWSCEKNVKITVTYSTPAGSLTDQYGGRGAELENRAVLYNKEKDTDGQFRSVKRDDSQNDVPIPGVFTKRLTGKPEDNGLIAKYTITVNEAMADLRNLQSLEIQDTMSSTLGFIAASLEIEYEDAEGNKGVLPQEQYKVSPVSSAADDPNKNTFTITLLHDALGSRKYTLTYGASIVGNSTVGLQYQNDASIALFGKNYVVQGDIIEVPATAITAETYEATLFKHDEADTEKGLNGAVFGLYVAALTEGEKDLLIHEYSTGESSADGKTVKGIAHIQTLPGENVILRTHTLYYVQERTAPEGYQLDTTKHYFWFCNNKDGISCSYSNDYGLEPYHAQCIYSAQTSSTDIDLKISNKKISGGHELPDTGGSGTSPYTVGGLLAIGAGLLLLNKDKKRRKGDLASS